MNDFPDSGNASGDSSGQPTPAGAPRARARTKINPVIGAPPVSTPPVSTPPVGAPRARARTKINPAIGAPPDSAPPAGAPPVSTPPDGAPRARARTKINPADGTPPDGASAPAPASVVDQLCNIAPGTKLRQFIIDRRLNISGEACLYLCHDESTHTQYVFKIYLREMTQDAIDAHSELMKRLRSTNSSNVVRIIVYGLYKGHVSEVMPYYAQGSLMDRCEARRFTEEEIKDFVLPKMAAILKTIHAADIYHSDIKPENIMIDGDELVLIDFGVSKLARKGERTIFVTSVGGTSQYMAPEVLKGILLPASDYYSLGMTLYPLLLGKTHGEYQIQLDTVQRIYGGVKPNGVSERMYLLIKGLTYELVGRRDDPTNPQRRWTDAEVTRWLRGDDMISPYEGGAAQPKKLRVEELVFNIEFNKTRYDTLPSLLLAMMADWDRGVQFLDRETGGFMAAISRASLVDSTLVPACKEVCDFLPIMKRAGLDKNQRLFTLACKYAGGFSVFYWCGMACRTIQELAGALLGATSVGTFSSLIAGRLLVDFIRQKPDLDDLRRKDLLAKLDTVATGSKITLKTIYTVGFLLQERPALAVGDGFLYSMAELKQYIAAVLRETTVDVIGKACSRFVNADGTNKDDYDAWLSAIGAH